MLMEGFIMTIYMIKDLMEKMSAEYADHFKNITEKLDIAYEAEKMVEKGEKSDTISTEDMDALYTAYDNAYEDLKKAAYAAYDWADEIQENFEYYAKDFPKIIDVDFLKDEICRATDNWIG